MTTTTLERQELRTLEPVLATAESLEGYGYVIGEPAGLSRDKIDFYGREVRVTQPAKFRGNDDLCLNLVTFQPRPLTVRWMEFHTKHTQTFIPLSGKPFYMVLGKPTCRRPDGSWDESEAGMPNPDDVRAFYFDGSGGIVMQVGVWHEVPFPLDGETHFVCICTNETNDNLEAQGPDGDTEGGDLTKRNLLKHFGYNLRRPAVIDLYTWTTPNGRKASIALEEMQLPYTVVPISLKTGAQKSDAFLKLNPNGRVPAIVDREADDFAVFESGAILIYLAEKCGRFLPREMKARSVVLQWLMWQMGGLGPMHGQANVFNRYFPEKLPSVIKRYQDELRRLLGVMDRRLADHAFLAGDYSIADMACWPWVSQHDWAGVSLDDLPNVQRWFDEVGARPAVQRGAGVPTPQAEPDADTGRLIVIGAGATV